MKKKKKSFSVKPVILLSAAALLLLGSTVGSARAALTYYSENYSVQMSTSNIGVSLIENGDKISYRDYNENDEWNESTGRKRSWYWARHMMRSSALRTAAP